MIPELTDNRDFFILDRDSVAAEISQFYGYYFDANEFNIRSNPCKILGKMTAGVFCNIQSIDNKIIVQQDYHCSFGIFIYRNNAYWAISNSFYMLTRYLASRFKLTINDEYTELFLFGLVPEAITETAIKEIEELAQGQYIEIDSANRTLEIRSYEYAKCGTPLLSEAGIALIDAWHDKYSEIIQSLGAQGYEISVDLSGGFDSRAAFACLLKPDILEQVTVFSPNNISWQGEEREIASRIAEIYGFTLGAIRSEGIKISSYEAILNSLNSRLFNTTQLCFKSVYFPRPVFNMNGNGGESFRDYYTCGAPYYIAIHAPNSVIFGRKIGDKARRCAWRTASYILEHYKENLPVGVKLYSYTHRKNHFGRSMVEGFLANLISVSPLLDPVLNELDLADNGRTDRNILMALIYARFLPETKAVPINGNRSIAPETWELAEQFSKANPVRPLKPAASRLSVRIAARAPQRPLVCQPRSPLTHFLEICKAASVREFITREYDEGIFDFIQSDVRPDAYQGFHNVTRAISKYFLEQALYQPWNNNFAYAPLYLSDSLTDDCCPLSPGIDISLSYKPLSGVSEFGGTPEACVEILGEHIVASPWGRPLETRKGAIVDMKISVPAFRLKEARLPFMVDIRKLIIKGDNDIVLFSATDVNFVGEAGFRATFLASEHESVNIYLEWRPNEMWYLETMSIGAEREKTANRKYNRDVAPGADRASNLFNM